MVRQHTFRLALVMVVVAACGGGGSSGGYGTGLTRRTTRHRPTQTRQPAPTP